MFTLRYALLLLFFTGSYLPVAANAEDAPLPVRPNPFFAYAFDAHGLSLNEQAKMLKEFGYAGIGWGRTQIPEMLKALEAHGLKMFSIYVTASVEADKPPYDADLKTAIEQLKGRDTLIWLQVNGGTPSSDDSDDRAVAILREIAEAAEKSGLRVALYPHVGTYVARVEDAVRLAKKVDRTNLGVCFNLCHFLKADNEKNIEQRLKKAMPHLFAVNINGADSGNTQGMNWDRLIQTLDRGTFDVRGMLATLDQLGYAGPIGLQCYGIPGDVRDNLKRSMNAWRKMAGAFGATWDNPPRAFPNKGSTGAPVLDSGAEFTSHPESRFEKKTPAEIDAFERDVAANLNTLSKREICDLALVPPILNTNPLPKFDYDQLDYGMTIAIAPTPKGRIWACWVAGEDGPRGFFVLNRSEPLRSTSERLDHRSPHLLVPSRRRGQGVHHEGLWTSRPAVAGQATSDTWT